MKSIDCFKKKKENRYQNKFIFILLLMLLALASCSSPQKKSATNLIIKPVSKLSLLWQEEKDRGPSIVIDENLQAILKKRQIVFVRGIFNEVLPEAYFKDNEDGAKELKIPYTTILSPPSSASIMDNAKVLAEKLKALYKKNKLPFILVGHSKGGCELLYMAITNLKLNEMIDKIILIQSPVRGSPVADLALDWCKEMWSPCHWLYAWASQGGYSIATKNAETIFLEKINKLPKDEKELLSKKIFYVRSYKLRDQAFEVSMTGEWLKNNYGPNDGLVLTSDQYLPSFGQDAGSVIADHADLVLHLTSKFKTKEDDKSARKAFTRALLRMVYSF